MAPGPSWREGPGPANLLGRLVARAATLAVPARAVAVPVPARTVAVAVTARRAVTATSLTLA